MAAQSWLVLRISRSATTLGVIVALQTLPVLLLGPYGGVIADRVDKRRLMVALQSAMGAAGADPRPAHDHRRRAPVGDRRARGAARPQQRLREPRAAVVHARDGRDREPAQRRQPQLRARERRAHHRPAVAGVLIATVGEGVCFLVNAASFAAVVASLITLDRSAITRARRAAASPDSCARACATSRGTPELAVPLLMMALVGAPRLRVPGDAAGDGAPGAARRARAATAS